MRTKTPLDRLQNVVSGQRYLLVLDDVWTRVVHKWEQLKACLQHGGIGSVVLTTTRDEEVAKMMGIVDAYNLTALEDKFIKEIIKNRAFGCLDKEEIPNSLLYMVNEVVNRCDGSPLAATALGSVLRTKTSQEEWKAVLSRSSIFTKENGILPILKISYSELPPHMKQCFAFCAIFPKGYEIDVDKLIQLWIAHGFIIQEKEVHLETIGKQIFTELAYRSFFLDVKQVQASPKEIMHAGVCYSRTICKIHDLMHDVALSLMEKGCSLAYDEPGKIESAVTTEEPSHSEWLPNTARHLFLSCKEPERKLDSSLKNSSPAIRTLLCDGYMKSSLRHLSKYSSLQALQVCLHRRSFPLKPKNLLHLRYLDLSGSHIKTLPKDMSILYQLQTLNLSGCISLSGLPRQMKYMTALRHLYTHGCPMLESMPRDFRKLTVLQTLTCFVAGCGSNCSNVGELGNLNLGGQLELCHLENVTEEDAKAANLKQNKELRGLTLKWQAGLDDSFEENSSKHDAKVLEKLKPHDGLHAIRIHNYRATTFPTWMTMLQNIVEIHLFCCEKLKWLFSYDFTFPNLKDLTLKHLPCLNRWWETDNGRLGEEIIFPRLENLLISGCEKLTALPGQETFPNLQNVHIEGCPKLTTAPKSPMLSVLGMAGHEAELFLWIARNMASLTNVVLTSLEDNTETTSAATEHGLREVLHGKEKWNDLDFPLSVLVLRDFKSDVSELCACFVHLQELSIVRCHVLVHWPEKEFQALVYLKRLMIDECDNLTGYAQASAEPSTSSETSQLLPRLESLTIKSCRNLVELFNVPPSLRTMEIYWCSKLKTTSGRRLQQGQLASSIHQGSSGVLEMPSSSSALVVAEYLEKLILKNCDGLTGVLLLPPSLKRLCINNCGGLTSLELCLGGITSLERLELVTCNTLTSLPDGPQVYSSLKLLSIMDCPGIKKLPTSLQQRLHIIQLKAIDAHYYED